MSNHGLVKVILTKQEAQWLYDMLAEKFDEGASTGRDELFCSTIADKVDAELGDLNG